MTARGFVGIARGAALALAIAACAAPRAARAADDGGTQSVFAYGTGSRALAMGSAFVAAADDASALFWNPAGLGIVERSVLEMHTSGDLGAGIHESFAGGALPSWHWGTAALSLRQFGASGIEQRDDRNVLLDSNLSDSEFELALGFGRAVGSIWSLGGALKVQRQSLGGLAASGMGVDLGVGANPPWTDRLRFGLTVRNALQPTLRLDRESVADPTTVRGGAAWHMPLGSGASSVLAEMDLEKPGTAGAKLHTGVEYRVLDAAALRAGMNGGVLTAGAGFRWHDLTVDYTFENTPLAAAHRVGLTLHMGQTVTDSRLAARRAQDQAVEQRLADAFRERQAQQIADLCSRARDAQQENRFDDALEAVSAALTLDPGNRTAQVLQVGALLAKARQSEQTGDFAGAAATYDLALGVAPEDSAAAAGVQRCRAESNRRAARNAQNRSLFAAAMDALVAEDFTSARHGFESVLHADPSDSEAVRMLARTRESLRRRASRLVDDANRAIRAGRLGDAATALDGATRLDSDVPGLDDALSALGRARQIAAVTRTPAAAGADGTRAASGAPGASPASTMSDHDVEELYRLGLAALKAQRTDDALRYWEHVWAERPGYREVGPFLKREYLARGMELFAGGRLEDAIAQWEKVLKIDANDAQARGYLARAQKQMERSREILGDSR